MVQTAASAVSQAGISKTRIFQFVDFDCPTLDDVPDWRHLIGTPDQGDRYSWPKLISHESVNTVATINYSSGTTGLPKGIVPQLQKEVKTLEVFMRSSTWISSLFGGGVLAELREDKKPGENQYTFTENDKKMFTEDPNYLLQFRKKIEAEINSLFGMYQQVSEASNTLRDVITKEVNRRLGPGNEKPKEFIIPKWSPGYRRISPGDGVTLDDDLGIGPNLYLGLSAPRFPNFYTIVGPGATWSSGTLLPSIETSVEYAVKCMKKIQTETIKSLDVKQEALDDIYAHFDEFHRTTVGKRSAGVGLRMRRLKTEFICGLDLLNYTVKLRLFRSEQ